MGEIWITEDDLYSIILVDNNNTVSWFLLFSFTYKSKPKSPGWRTDASPPVGDLAFPAIQLPGGKRLCPDVPVHWRPTMQRNPRMMGSQTYRLWRRRHIKNAEPRTKTGNENYHTILAAYNCAPWQFFSKVTRWSAFPKEPDNTCKTKIQTRELPVCAPHWTMQSMYKRKWNLDFQMKEQKCKQQKDFPGSFSDFLGHPSLNL